MRWSVGISEPGTEPRVLIAPGSEELLRALYLQPEHAWVDGLVGVHGLDGPDCLGPHRASRRSQSCQ